MDTSATPKESTPSEAVDPRWLNESQQQAWRSLVALVTRLPAALDAQLQRDSQLTHFDYFVLATVSENPQRRIQLRDLASEFAEVGATRVGISADAVAKQAEFAAAQSFDYPLLSDEDGAVATAFGVKRGLLAKLSPVKRATFVIGTDRKVLETFSSELRFEAHADKALEYLRAHRA